MLFCSPLSQSLSLPFSSLLFYRRYFFLFIFCGRIVAGFVTVCSIYLWSGTGHFEFAHTHTMTIMRQVWNENHDLLPLFHCLLGEKTRSAAKENGGDSSRKQKKILLMRKYAMCIHFLFYSSEVLFSFSTRRFFFHDIDDMPLSFLSIFPLKFIYILSFWQRKGGGGKAAPIDRVDDV